MFGRSRRRREEEEAEEFAAKLALKAEDTVTGTMPEVAEIGAAYADDGLTEGVGTGAGPAGMGGDTEAPVPLAANGEAIRLFPGFEREDFEVGFAMGGRAPALVMRWKDGGDWFRMPAMFNRSVLAAMDERDSAGDLSRLLRSFGYEVE